VAPRIGARWAIWLVSLAALCAVAAWRVNPAAPIETNILALLPQRHDAKTLDIAAERTRNAFSQQVLALVRGPDDARTGKAAQAALGAMRKAGLQPDDAGSQVAPALDLYRRHHFALLTPAKVRKLDRGGPMALANAVAASLASPAGMVRIGADPGGFLAGFIADLPRPYPDFLPENGLLSARRGSSRVFLLRLTTPAAAFGSEGSQQAAQAVKAARRAVAANCAACRFEATGAALFSDAARREAKQETTWLTIVSTLLIMLLIAYVYRSLAPHLLGFLQLGASVAAAAAAVIAIFGSINILTLVFGTTLLGIAIDYAFLYFPNTGSVAAHLLA
jgi:predicted exporter